MRGMSQTFGMHKSSVCLAINPSFDGLRPTQLCSQVQFIGVGREANTHGTQSHRVVGADATSHADLGAYPFISFGPSATNVGNKLFVGMIATRWNAICQNGLPMMGLDAQRDLCCLPVIGWWSSYGMYENSANGKQKVHGDILCVCV
jgi:hypothetical protein